MEDLKVFFKNDRFAYTNGMELGEIGEGWATAQMEVAERHLNAGGVCQGGAIFTLADLATAAVANSRGKLTLSVAANISFLHSAKKGSILTARAREVVDHRRLPFIEVSITDENNVLIASTTSTCYRKDTDI